MTAEERVEQINLLRIKMIQISQKQSVCGERYDGYMALYRAACHEDNCQEIERYRELLFGNIGSMLDNIAAQSMLANQLTALQTEL